MRRQHSICQPIKKGKLISSNHYIALIVILTNKILLKNAKKLKGKWLLIIIKDTKLMILI